MDAFNGISLHPSECSQPLPGFRLYAGPTPFHVEGWQRTACEHWWAPDAVAHWLWNLSGDYCFEADGVKLTICQGAESTSCAMRR